MGKKEELCVLQTNEVIKKLNSSSMLPFIGKEKVLMMFVDFSNAITGKYRKDVKEHDKKVLCRLAELDKLYEEREKERLGTLVKAIDGMRNEMLKIARLAFCHGVCKYLSSVNNTTLCYCSRRQKFLKSLEEDFSKYIENNKEKIITKFKEVSWEKKK